MGRHHAVSRAGCRVEAALEAASLHPAQLLGLEKSKGSLDFGADAGEAPCRRGPVKGWVGARVSESSWFLPPW